MILRFRVRFSSLFYKMNKEDYEKLMHENITKTYKKTNESKIKTINKSAKKIANRLDLEDRTKNYKRTEII